MVKVAGGNKRTCPTAISTKVSIKTTSNMATVSINGPVETFTRESTLKMSVTVKER